jgi:hypothetical protein
MVTSAANILRTLKTGLPYLIRFQVPQRGSRVAHEDLESTQVTLDPLLPITPESIIAQTVRQLPIGWHATMLPSHVIIYKDDNRRFPRACRQFVGRGLPARWFLRFMGCQLQRRLTSCAPTDSAMTNGT